MSQCHAFAATTRRLKLLRWTIIQILYKRLWKGRMWINECM